VPRVPPGQGVVRLSEEAHGQAAWASARRHEPLAALELEDLAEAALEAPHLFTQIGCTPASNRGSARLDRWDPGRALGHACAVHPRERLELRLGEAALGEPRRVGPSTAGPGAVFARCGLGTHTAGTGLPWEIVSVAGCPLGASGHVDEAAALRAADRQTGTLSRVWVCLELDGRATRGRLHPGDPETAGLPPEVWWVPKANQRVREPLPGAGRLGAVVEATWRVVDGQVDLVSIHDELEVTLPHDVPAGCVGLAWAPDGATVAIFSPRGLSRGATVEVRRVHRVTGAPRSRLPLLCPI
jgi:hypothetical protein